MSGLGTLTAKDLAARDSRPVQNDRPLVIEILGKTGKTRKVVEKIRG
jgi:hypothetical protein